MRLCSQLGLDMLRSLIRPASAFSKNFPSSVPVAKKKFQCIYKLALGLLLTLTLAACNNSKEQLYEEQVFALGSLINISIWDVDPILARQAGAELARDFQHIHNTWHAWRPSELTRINEALANNVEVAIDPGMIELIQRATELSQTSGDLFNPAIGRLVALWGFLNDDPSSNSPPDPAALADLVTKRPVMSDLRIEGNRLRSTNPAVRLVFGAIGQGYAADRALAQLQKLGIQNAMVDVSGDIGVLGQRGKRPWRVGIRDSQGKGVIATLEIHDGESIVTSGTYGRFFEYEGKRYHHIIDPRTGYPAVGAVSVTVLHNDVTTADAAATALLIAGPDQWHAVARAMGLKHVMLIDDTGAVHIDPALAERIRFETGTAPQVRLSPPL